MPTGMISGIRIRAEAEADIKEAFDWYEARVAGLGDAYVQEIDACLQRIADNPLSYSVIYKRVRRALHGHFPYGIFYVVKNEDIVVIACFHGSRDPKLWRKRS